MVNWNQLATAWSADHGFVGSGKVQAMQRTLPLLEDTASVPFVCRYRADIVAPLSTKEVHKLAEMFASWNSLQSLRKKILDKIQEDTQLQHRVQSSISKSELEDLYAPFKPPSKGSLEDRIAKEHPHLKAEVDAFWQGQQTTSQEKKLRPREAAVTLLANKIASHTPTTDALLEYVERFAKVKASKVSPGKDVDAKTRSENDKKYATYYDFSVAYGYIRDHQVLAIRRGVNNKAIKLSYDIDAERTESRIRRSLLDEGVQLQGKAAGLWADATKDAWSRLLRKRITSRLWKDKCTHAEEKSMEVFRVNLLKALLAPPLSTPKPLLALDPGFAAGIKACLLQSTGQLLFQDEETSLVTVKFLQNRKEGIETLISLLQILYSAQDNEHGNTAKTTNGKMPKPPVVTVALGNGHGSQEARQLVRDASDKCGIPIDIQLVSEAGASVWSVTEGASREFPSQAPAAIASVSIGRRYQNPLPELVKIPPRSLGLGMYQHDLKETELDEKLRITSIHAVAEVGVDGNSCSAEILEKIPGLTSKLAQRIIEARPLRARNDMLERVSGIGTKTYENCAAFIKVAGDEPLDATLVHPESYPLARYLLKKLKWNLADKASIRKADLPQTKHGRCEKWGDLIEKAAVKYSVTQDRVDSVVGHLISSITNPDPRLGGTMSIVGSSPVASAAKATDVGSVDGCSLLPSSTSTSIGALRKACPLRGIVATVRNVVDFGAFVDFGGENDGLLHRSKLGPVSLSSLLVGQEVGVDILSVSDNGRVAIALNGLNCDPEPSKPKQTNGKNAGKRSYSTTARKPENPPAKRRRAGRKG
ncbi:S1 RNA-binding domain-containing protein 1 [Seminavis robusta]|uniref:S1 RNA-binding domain-containing protein 1 n=1 Tax=Seminavis robusta TaxID=568900 RepID=A0A9N8F082_9STRA|nr:S1 RNA-binding domain-containing protein 1 [Seminavis robusta]|eukprot:Sro2549_g330900.1 S1 RNA-binding domain-containing protein 1 (818) ;mRNA; f:6482-8935